MMCCVQKNVIRALPYHVRCQKYNAEKQEMYRQNVNAPASVLAAKLNELVRKWMI